MPIVKLNQKAKRVEVDSFEFENELVFEFFNSLPVGERDKAFMRAIQIGVLAIKEDRISAFLANTANQLGTELENLKMIFDMRQELFFKSAVKGAIAETEIAAFLNDYFLERKLKDRAEATGTTKGQLARNKTGDIVCTVDGDENLRIVIECKLDKSIRMGEIENRDLFSRQTDTVWSQLLESNANRDGTVPIIVLDISLIDGVISRQIEGVDFIPAIGFVAIVDTQRGDYSNLAIAYMLARNIAIESQEIELDPKLLQVLVKRIIKDISDALSIEKLITANIENNREVLKRLNKGMLSMQFSSEVLTRFLKSGTLTKEELFEYYMGEDVRKKYKLLEPDIDAL